MLIDTHIHLDAAEYAPTREAVIGNAVAAGVAAFVLPGVMPSQFAAMEALAAGRADMAIAVGIHPLYVDQVGDDGLLAVRARLEQGGVVAVGEIGLDFYVEGLDLERQIHFYHAQLQLARAFELPVLLHVRRAQDAILKHLRQVRVVGGIAHAFNGSRQQADAFIDLGFKLGFGGAMTYSGSRRIRELAASLPLSAIVLETDGPDIPPAWRPEGPSLPAELRRYAEILAELRGIETLEVIQATGHNARAVLPGLLRG